MKLKITAAASPEVPSSTETIQSSIEDLLGFFSPASGNLW